MSRFKAALFIAACALTAGCAGSGPSGTSAAYEQRKQEWQAANPAAAPAGEFPLVDGTYKGAPQILSAQGTGCPAARPGIIDIGDRWVIYPYQPDLLFIARVQEDGTFSAGANGGTLEGHLGGGWLVFNVRTPSCETEYKLRWTM